MTNTKKLRAMTKQQIKIEIEKLAKEENLTFIEAASAMQGAAAKMGSEEMITVIHELKMESIAQPESNMNHGDQYARSQNFGW